MTESDALKLARDAYASSTSYVDSNYRKKWENNLRAFQSRHKAESKYHSESYKYRSKGFRPKTRSGIRKLEAATAAAYFSNQDVVTVEATNKKLEPAVQGAAVMKELLQHRLTKTIPWFMTVVGGMQDASTIGVVCSYQYWKYREKRTTRKDLALDANGVALVDTSGEPVYNESEDVKVLEDEPCIELIAAENLRIDPASHWYNPIKTSPYLIELLPMYVCDIREMFEATDPKTGQPKWNKATDQQLLAATNQKYDSTRQTRENNRQDPQSETRQLTEYDIAWVHRNIFKRNGEDVIFYTLGVEHILSKPQPLKEVYLHGERPYAMGVAIIETHKIYPDSVAQIGDSIQTEINEVSNARMDNVRLVLNKRYIVKRGAQVDVKSLVRNVAGSTTFANNPDTDVRTLDFTDVTGSSYQEQDRLAVDYDELVGNFSQSSVMSNRKLNETVGGMAMMGQGANAITEYTIRTLTETWIEPVLRQLAQLEAKYETDEVVLAIAGGKAGVDQVTDDMLNQDLTLTVNVGMGATDPTFRLNRLISAATSAANIAKNATPGMNVPKIVKEIFSIAGYRDGGQFYDEEQDPRLVAAEQQIKILMQEMEKLHEAVTGKEAEDAKIAAEIDKLQAETLKVLKEAGIEPSAALLALGTMPGQMVDQVPLTAQAQPQGEAPEIEQARIEQQTRIREARIEAQTAIEVARIANDGKDAAARAQGTEAKETTRQENTKLDRLMALNTEILRAITAKRIRKPIREDGKIVAVEDSIAE